MNWRRFRSLSELRWPVPSGLKSADTAVAPPNSNGHRHRDRLEMLLEGLDAEVERRLRATPHPARGKHVAVVPAALQPASATARELVALEPGWRDFIAYCRELEEGEILWVQISHGVPVLPPDGCHYRRRGE